MKTYTSYPVNDHKIYIAKGECRPFERTAVIIEHNDDARGGYEFNTLFVNEYADVEDGDSEYWETADVHERYDYIGTKGDTIVPRDLSSAFLPSIEYGYGVEDLFEWAEKYFTIDKSKAEEVLTIRLNTMICIPSGFRMDVYSKWFSFGTHPIFFNLETPDYKDNEQKHGYSLFEVLVQPLVSYSKYLGREIKLDIDFANDDNYLCSDEQLETINKSIQAIREKYLPQIRKYIAEKYKEELEEYDKPYKAGERNPNAKQWKNANMDGFILELGK